MALHIKRQEPPQETIMADGKMAGRLGRVSGGAGCQCWRLSGNEGVIAGSLRIWCLLECCFYARRITRDRRENTGPKAFHGPAAALVSPLSVGVCAPNIVPIMPPS